MDNCKRCGGALNQADKFCGDCGAPVQIEEAAGPAPAQFTASPEEPPRPMETPPPTVDPAPAIKGSPPSHDAERPKRKSALGILAGVILGGGAMLVAVSYPTGPSESDHEPAADLNDGVPIPGPTSSDLMEGISPDQPTSSMSVTQIQPGRWIFESEVTGAAMQGTGEPARPNGQELLGFRRSFESCISPEQAASPQAQILADGFSEACPMRNARMIDGVFEGTLSCIQPQNGSGYDMSLTGDYDDTNITLTSSSTILINQGVGGFEGLGNAMMTSIINGRFAGACQ